MPGTLAGGDACRYGLPEKPAAFSGRDDRNDSDFIATTEQHWIVDRVVIAVQELETDKRIASDAAADRLFGERNGGAFQNDRDITAGFGSMCAFHVVTKNEAGMKAAQRDISPQRDERAAGVFTATGLDGSAGHCFAEQVRGNALALHASA
jgi:hypothetical protein